MAEEIQEEPQVVGPGAQLKARREALNLSVEDIAERLHLRPAVVEELENDHYDHTVSMTFTKGYVRLYAKHLEMQPEPLLVLFEQLTNPIKQPTKLKSFSQKVAKQASDARLMMVTWFIILVMLGLAGVWWWQLPDDSTLVPTTIQEPMQSTASQENAASADANDASTDAETVGGGGDVTLIEDGADSLAIETVNESASETDVVPANNDLSLSEHSVTGGELASDTAEISETTEVINDDESPEQDVLAAEGAEPQPETSEDSLESLQDTSNTMALMNAETAMDNSASESEVTETSLADADALNGLTEEPFNVSPITSQLVFTFSEDCWMNLTDATGEVIAYGVKTAGRVMEVAGIPPFEVVLGAPAGVQLTVDGENFDMSVFPAGRTARFTVGEAQ